MSDWQEEILKQWSKAKKENYIDDEIRDLLTKNFSGEVLYREPMSKHTSMRVGGPADAYLKAQSLKDVQYLMSLAAERDVPISFFGAGSNTLVKDGGIRGFVLSSGGIFQECKVVGTGDASGGDWGDIEAGCAVKINRCVQFAKENGLSGMENWAGIPGTMGGAAMMNAGAHGVEAQDIIRSITVIDKEGEKIIPREKLDFEYRKLKIPRACFVLNVTVRLKKAPVDEISAKIEQYQKWRVEKQPINFPNLGSVFKNPQPQKKNQKLPSAGQLIDELGLKNVRVGGARISDKHANFIINENNACAKDVLVLISLIKDKVKDATGIALETEVKVIGEDA